jgi:hypothetical protein
MKPGPRFRFVVAAGAAICTLLQTAVAVLEFYDVTPAGLGVALPVLWTCVASGAAVYCLAVLRETIREWLIEQRLVPIGPIPTAWSSTWARVISAQPQLLLMTLEEVGCRAGLSVHDLEFLQRRPWFVPRIDVQARIREAMLLPADWTGDDDYGDEYTIARLKFYALEKDVVSYARLPQLLSATPNKRKAVLRMTERHVLTMVARRGRQS